MIETEQHPTRLRIVVRRALTRKIGKENLGAIEGRAFFHFRQQLGRVFRAGELHGPIDTRGRAQHHAHLVPHARQAMAERVHRLGGIRQEFRRHEEQHARGAQRQESIARLDDADSCGARGIVAATASHRYRIHAPISGDLLAQRARDVRALDEFGHVRFGKTRGGQHLGRPATLAHVQPQRARRVRGITRLLAGHEQPHVVLRQQHAARVLEHRRFVLPHPDELGCSESRHRDVAGDLAGTRFGLLERGALLFAAPVVPENGGTQGLVRRVEQRRAMHLTREPDGLHGLAQRRRQRFDRRVRRAPPVSGVLLGPAGLGTGNVERRGRLFDHRVFVVDKNGFDTGRADIDA